MQMKAKINAAINAEKIQTSPILSITELGSGESNENYLAILQNGKITFIDWELAVYNDNARDFATFFYPDISYFNWRIVLDKSQQEILINNYLENYGYDSNIRERIQVWLVLDKMSAAIYCHWKSQQQKNNAKYMQMSERLLANVISKIQ